MRSVKRNYESPFVKGVQLEIEGCCAGSVVHEKKSEIISAGQEIGNVFDVAEEGNAWSTDEWE